MLVFPVNVSNYFCSKSDVNTDIQVQRNAAQDSKFCGIAALNNLDYENDCPIYI